MRMDLQRILIGLGLVILIAGLLWPFLLWWLSPPF